MPIIWKFGLLMVFYIFFSVCSFPMFLKLWSLLISSRSYTLSLSPDILPSACAEFLCVFKLDYWVFQFYVHFSLSPFQCFFLIIEFHSQVLNWLLHFHQSHACVSLSITWCLFLLWSFSLILLSYFCAFFKLLKFFDEVYNCSFKFFVPIHQNSSDWPIFS